MNEMTDAQRLLAFIGMFAQMYEECHAALVEAKYGRHTGTLWNCDTERCRRLRHDVTEWKAWVENREEQMLVDKTGLTLHLQWADVAQYMEAKP